jgi:uncharacterized lipoprotein YddW (UPF0748 family)
MKKQHLLKAFAALAIAVLVASCSKDDNLSGDEGGFDPTKNEIAMPKREIRAAWIATVYNLDWPTTKSNADAQKNELKELLQASKAMNFNAVILQIRPMADALYASNLEPWSSVLTGTQGTDPGYDPLAFAVEEAHKLGLQLHAWMNPYRIGSTSAVLAQSHVAVKNPSWVVTFNGTKYFNPGIPEVRAHLIAVVKDVITRYKVDAIHFDDYFYPSGAKATDPFVFDDKSAFEKYGNGLTITQWREQNVNTMVREVYTAIKSTKPSVAFGISPAGVRDNSLALYADPLVWLENKWVDYLAPQVYWEIGHATADFAKQAAYWSTNAKGVPMIIGIAAYKYKDSKYPAYGTVEEFGKEIDEVRKYTNLFGEFFYRAKNLLASDLSTYLKTKYPTMAIPPVFGNPTAPIATAPEVALAGSTLSWKAVASAEKYVTYVLTPTVGKQNSYQASIAQIGTELSVKVESGKIYVVSALNADNVESAKSKYITVP